MPDSSRNGLRSTKAPEVQNWPTLSVVKDDTTSGAFGPPARRAWLILSSVMLPTTLTWMLGFSFSNASTVAWMASTSLSALHPCQKVIVVSASGLSLLPPPPSPVQAATASGSVSAAAMAAMRRVRVVGMVMVLSVPAGLCSTLWWGLDGVEDVVPGGVEGGLQGTGEHRTVVDARQLEARLRGSQGAELVGDQAEQPVAAGGRARHRRAPPAPGRPRRPWRRGRARTARRASRAARRRRPGCRAPWPRRPWGWWRGCRGSGPGPAPAGRRPAPGSRRRCPGGRRGPAGCRAAAGSRPRPAPPVAPPWIRPSITIAAPRPSSAQSSRKSSTPRARPERSSAMAARLTSLSTSNGMPSASASRSSSCGVVPAREVPGVAQPAGARVEGAGRPDDHVREAGARHAGRGGRAVQRLQDVGDRVRPGRRGVRSSYSPTTRPVMSATAATMPAGVTSSAATYAAARVDGVQLGPWAGAAAASCRW